MIEEDWQATSSRRTEQRYQRGGLIYSLTTGAKDALRLEAIARFEALPFGFLLRLAVVDCELVCFSCVDGSGSVFVTTSFLQ